MMSLILSAALKGTVLLVLARIATLLLRRSAADLRHRIWLAAICGMPLLMIPVKAPEIARVSFVYSITAGAAPVVASSTDWWTAAWAVGFGLVMLRFVVGVVQLDRMTRKAQVTDGLLLSDEIATPLTWARAIVLPGYAREWSAEKVAVAMAHERAHLARWDWMTQSAAQVVTAVFWFHPLMWFAAAQLRQEAEQAVDDAVLRSGTEAASYAEQLLDVARRLHGSAPVTGVAMVRRSVLTERVKAILDAGRVRTMSGWKSRVLIVAVGVWLLMALAPFEKKALAQAVAPVVLAQVPTPTPAPRIDPPTPTPKPAPVSVPRPAAVPTPGEVYSVGGGVTPPTVIYSPQPVFPEEARAAQAEGEVRLSVVVDENGLPTQIAVTQGFGMGLDEAAIEAIHQWRFKPAMKDGQPVSFRAVMEVKFRLR
ncbi:MAG: M56 family metallopeptidase [Bryobacteraceae bacterium]